MIRKALLDAKVIDAVISLPLSVFFGAGVPACLVILRKDREPWRHDKVLMVYAARHFRALSAQNQLRPQDVMRILVHYEAYGRGPLVETLVARHRDRIHADITRAEEEEAARLTDLYAVDAERLVEIDADLASARAEQIGLERGKARSALEVRIVKLEKARERPKKLVVERDEAVAEAVAPRKIGGRSNGCERNLCRSTSTRTSCSNRREWLGPTN